MSSLIAIKVSTLEVKQYVDKAVRDFHEKENYKDFGIFTGVYDIKNEIKQERKNFKIISYDDGVNKKVLMQYFSEQSSYSDFLKDVIVEKIVNNDEYALNIKENIFLISDNTLVIKEIEKDKIEKLSTTIGWVLVKNYFDPNYIKENPNLLNFKALLMKLIV